MGKRKRLNKNNGDYVEKLTKLFKQRVQDLLESAKFKELVQMYQDQEEFANDAEEMVWRMTEKEIKKRNENWLEQNKITR